ncbi:hypothetical protein MRB53_004908 [Persea americana]|uniref:Uncharacterized protein n=1 Tax=Persea americana TaxID=3435 RepID=A0ACC2MCH0_PERAE|nr:hypothetical protein MRB53_004908 [Persea americana]
MGLLVPLDVVKSRLQAETQLRHHFPPPKYHGIVDCFRKSVREEGYGVLWRGLGTAVARAFVENGAIFAAYEVALRCFCRNERKETAACITLSFLNIISSLPIGKKKRNG